MRQRPFIFAVLAAVVVAGLGLPARAQYPDQRALDLAESRYQQAARETYHARRAFDDAAARASAASKSYEAALDEQRVAGRLLAEANVNGPRIAEAVRQAEAAVEVERQKVAPQYAPVEAAAVERRRAEDRAMAALPEWQQAQARLEPMQEAHDAAVDDRFAVMYESEDYLDLLATSWDAQAAAVSLRDTPNVDQTALIDATRTWMASLDALDAYEARVINDDPAVRAAADALAKEEANQEALRATLAEQVAGDPEVQRAWAALTVAQDVFNANAVSLGRAQSELDARRGELTRIDEVAESARQRLIDVERKLPALATAITQAEETAKRAEAELVALQNVEQRRLQDREGIAVDLARAPIYPPEPVYIEPPIVIVDGGTSVYYPPQVPNPHQHDRRHDRDKDRDHDHHAGDDRDRHRESGDGGTRRDDGSSGTRRDDGVGGTRRDDGNGTTRRDDGNGTTRRDDIGRSARDREGDTPARRDEPSREQVPKQAPGRPNRAEPTPPEKSTGDDAATARRKQEEAKATERQRREDAASAASARQREQQQDSARAESRRQQQETARQRQQSESPAREQQREQERNTREASRSEDRGSRYERGDR